MFAGIGQIIKAFTGGEKVAEDPVSTSGAEAPAVEEPPAGLAGDLDIKEDSLRDHEFMSLMNDLFGEYDEKRYGMPVAECQRYREDLTLQEEFLSKYGIELAEYVARLATGENMGETKNLLGRWDSIVD